MLINEVTSSSPSPVQLIAIIKQVIGRMRDTGVHSALPTQSLLKILRNNGVVLSLDDLQQMSQRPPLNNMISDVSKHEVTFADMKQNQPDEQPAEVAKDTRSKLAKSVLKK